MRAMTQCRLSCTRMTWIDGMEAGVAAAAAPSAAYMMETCHFGQSHRCASGRNASPYLITGIPHLNLLIASDLPLSNV